MSSKDDLAEQLLGLAGEDLIAAKALDDAEAVPDSKSGFYAQQVVEKALKAVLATQGVDFPFTHNLTLLMQLCEDAGFKLPAGLDDADRLTPYAAALRYGLGDPQAVASQDALRWAALAVEWADAELHPTH